MEMQICTFFNPELTWTDQLTPIVGQKEVKKLQVKLAELHVPQTKLDTLQIFFTSMFPSPPPDLETCFADLLRDIGSWPLVILSQYIISIFRYSIWLGL